jgi:hypothetical protein
VRYTQELPDTSVEETTDERSLTRAAARAALVGGDVAPGATTMKTVTRIVSWA